jgi:hypothetical protein
MTIKFSPEYLRNLQEHILKSYTNMPTKCRLQGMDRDLDPAETRALVHFEAAITILNHMGAIKDGVLDDIVPKLYSKANDTIWGD